MMHSKYLFIHAFFSSYALPEASKEIKALIEAAASDKVWKGKIPGDLLWLAENLQELISTVFALDKWNEDDRAIITPDWKDYYWPVNTPALYCGWQKGYNTWHFMPRHLNKKEFVNPYLALIKFRNYRIETEWKTIIQQLLHHALIPMGYEDGNTILQLGKLLHKLVEACHLIEVRTNERILEMGHKEKSEKA